MSLFKKVATGVGLGLVHPLAGIGYGLSQAGRGGGGNFDYTPTPPMTASDVKLDPALTKVLGDVGTSQENNIRNVYAKTRAQFAQDARPQGNYLETRLPVAESQSVANLKNALSGIAGNTAYQQAKAQREYTQNENLARQIGELNKPSLLEEILGGVATGAGAGANVYGLLKALGKTGGGVAATSPAYHATPDVYDPTTFGPRRSDLSLYNPTYGYARYY